MKNNHKDKYKLLGLNIAYYRKLNGYAQEFLAEKLDATEQQSAKSSLQLPEFPLT